MHARHPQPISKVHWIRRPARCRRPAAAAAAHKVLLAGEWNELSKIKIFSKTAATDTVWRDFRSKFCGPCEVCGGSSGACVKCSVDDCTARFHPHCALHAGYENWLHSTRASVVVARDPDVQATLLFCQQHSSATWKDTQMTAATIERIRPCRKKRKRKPPVLPSIGPPAAAAPTMLEVYRRRQLNPPIQLNQPEVSTPPSKAVLRTACTYNAESCMLAGSKQQHTATEQQPTATTD